MHYVLIYETVENYEERRLPYRADHLKLAQRALEEGNLVMAGAFHPPNGAMLIFRGDDASVARTFAENDPYVTNGLVTKWEVKELNTLVGG